MNRFFSVELEIPDVQASYLPEENFSDSDSDAIDSDVEFHLYSQLHYSSSYYEDGSQDSNALSTSAENNAVTPLLEDDITDDDCDVIDGDESLSEVADKHDDKVGPFKREDVSRFH